MILRKTPPIRPEDTLAGRAAQKTPSPENGEDHVFSVDAFAKPIERCAELLTKLFAENKEDVERMVREENERVKEIQIHKLYALYRVHINSDGLDVSQLAEIAYSGLRVVEVGAKKRGRQPEWEGARGVQLLNEVSAIQERHFADTGKPLSVPKALAKRFEALGVKSNRLIMRKVTNLEPRYYEARRAKKKRDEG
jgi:hypothetical protein